ncbi:hypothetical protein [Kaistella sp.]|uniref:hypothetical protein n=1 Tax=Kaistella sp. TaxID=2782235 RepID=UPI002F943CE3
MKKIFILLSLVTFAGISAQDRPIQVEVTDRTEITMLAAQWDVLQQQKRQEQAELNYDTANYNHSVIGSNLYKLSKLTSDTDILKQIDKAEKQNNKLLNLYNSRRYQTKFYELQSLIRQISANIQRSKP